MKNALEGDGQGQSEQTVDAKTYVALSKLAEPSIKGITRKFYNYLL